MLTKDEIDELERLHKEALGGEWVVDCFQIISQHDESAAVVGNIMELQDGALIVAVRNLLPRIIAALREKS